MLHLLSKTITLAFIGIIYLTTTPVFSSQVTYPDDSYTTGDTLTATDLNNKFNEVKSNINDNDTRLTTQEGKNRIVVVDSVLVTSGNFQLLRVKCPTTHPIAISGGVDVDNVFTYIITSSAPVFDDGAGGQQRALLTADGQYSESSIVGWQGSVRNNSATTGNMIVVAICSN